MNDLITVGQKIYLQPSGNYARDSKTVRTATITAVKRKYFYAKIDDRLNFEEKFEIETLKNINGECNSAWIVWFSMEDYQTETDRLSMLKQMREFFNYGGGARELPYSTVKTIFDIAASEAPNRPARTI